MRISMHTLNKDTVFKTKGWCGLYNYLKVVSKKKLINEGKNCEVIGYIKLMLT